MRGKLEKRWDDFSGGVRTRLSATGVTAAVNENELAMAQDMTWDRDSGLRRRNGHHNQFSYAPTFGSMYGARGLPAGAASQLFLADHPAGAVYSYTVAGGLSAAVVSGLSANRQYEFMQGPVSGGQGPVYMLNGAEARQFTGAAGAAWTAASGTLPLGYYTLYHGNRAWIARADAFAGLADPKSALWWSGLADPRDWSTGGSVQFDPNDGDRITGISRIGPYLLVFKTTKTWLVYDLDTGANRQISGEIGAVSHRAMIETRKGTYFLTRDRGLAVCDGSTIKLIDDKINVVDYVDTSLTGPTYASWMTSINDRLYLQFVLAGGGFSLLYEYNIENDSWWPTTKKVGQMVVWDGAGSPELWAIDTGTKTLARMFARRGSNQRDYNNIDIIAVFEPSSTDFGTDRRKRVRAITIQGPVVAAVTPTVDDLGGASIVVDTATSGAYYPRAKIPRAAGQPPGRRYKVHVQSLDIGAPQRFEPQVITMHADPRAD